MPTLLSPWSYRCRLRAKAPARCHLIQRSLTQPKSSGSPFPGVRTTLTGSLFGET